MFVLNSVGLLCFTNTDNINNGQHASRAYLKLTIVTHCRYHAWLVA